MKLPEAFSERMKARLGEEWPAFLSALDTPPPTSVRLHPRKGEGLFSSVAGVPWHPLGRVLTNRPHFESDPLWHAGAYYVQEASGMSVRLFLPEGKPLRVIDLSAAPGGKATLVLGEIGWEGGLLVANDPDPLRRVALRENLERWGIPAYIITGRHPRWWAERYPGAFDVVILDAPCSGEGLWRRDPKALCLWSPSHSQRMQRLQRSLLFSALQLVAPGGILIYSTCTYAPQENEENLAYVFSEAAAWEPIEWTSPPPAVQTVAYGEAGGIGYYFYPHRGPGEGFFISAWRRRGKRGHFRSVPLRISRKKSPYVLPHELLAFSRGEGLYGLTATAAEVFLPGLAEEKWEAFPLWRHSRPSHAAALLDRGMQQAFPERVLEEGEFDAYLRGEVFSFRFPFEWVTYQGRGIGWLYRGRPSLPLTWKRFLRNR
ncbi:MAG: RsmB/NOP family class I SAM-dependent RNA methyltransferase [Bacteroidia bacterium]|nr:RsmB/NOP family class I SAM-dependent RNA methyltransferase [Bacteroidia bacterium]